MRFFIGRVVGLAVAACLVLVASTTVTFVLSAKEFRDRASRFDTTDVDAESLLYFVEVKGRKCDDVNAVRPSRLVRAEATCAVGPHPVRVMVFDTAYDLTEKLNDRSLSTRCNPAGTRHYVLAGLVLLRTTDRRVAGAIAESFGGFVFSSYCRSSAQ